MVIFVNKGEHRIDQVQYQTQIAHFLHHGSQEK